jgi:ribosomal protein S3
MESPSPVGKTLHAKSLKVSLVLDAAEVVAQAPRAAVPASRVGFRIEVSGLSLTASLNAKSVRRAIATIHESGAEMVAVVLSGRLSGDAIEDAGVSALPKGPKPVSGEGGAS